MKKVLLLFFFLLSLPACAMQLQGGVYYDVNSARDYVFEEIPKFQYSGYLNFERNSEIEKIVYSHNTNGEIIAITVLYRKEMNKAYVYGTDKKLIYVDIYDKNVNLYPHRGYRYDLKGNLILTSLSVSENEHFRFDPDGNLIAHSINNVIYDEKGRVIGSGSVRK